MIDNDYLIYVRIKDPELKSTIDDYENFTNMVSKMSEEAWEEFVENNKNYLFVDKVEFVRKRRALLREVLCNLNSWKQYSFQTMLNMADVSLKEKEKALKLYREQQAEKIKRQREWEKQERASRKEEWEKQEKTKVEKLKKIYIRQLSKIYDSVLIDIINSTDSLSKLIAYKNIIDEAVEENEKRKVDRYLKALKNIGITEENAPELFEINNYKKLIKESKDLVSEKMVNICGAILGFDIPEYIEEYVYISSIDKRLYTDTVTNYKKAFDIIDVNMSICYGSTIEEKMKWLKDNQKDIIKYTYFCIFYKYTNIHSGNFEFFPIRFIKPTVYRANGNKTTDTVDLNIIFELKRPKRKGGE